MAARILIVDDEYHILFSLKAILEREGYEVRTCVYAREALQAVGDEQGNFDVVVLDYMLPDLRGDAVAMALKHLYPTLPIIFITGFVIPDEAAPLAAAILTKPEAPKRLLEVVRSLIPNDSTPNVREQEWKMVRILVADDHDVVRKGVRALLHGRNNFIICGEAVNGRDAIEKARVLNPDLILLDITMPEVDGLDAARAIKSATPGIPILILTMHNTKEMIGEVKRIGLQGYVTKSEIAERLVRAIEAVTHNDQPFFPA